MIKTNWDLSQIYSSFDEFDVDFEKVKLLLKKLEDFEGKLKVADKNIIKEFFVTSSDFSSLIEKLAVFVHCKRDDDGRDDESARKYMQVNDFYYQAIGKLSFAKSEIISLDTDFLNQLREDKDFEDYSRDIEYYLRVKNHTPTQREEEIISNVSSIVNADDVYNLISSIEMSHGKVKDDSGKVVKMTTGNYNLLLKSKSQNTRKNVMKNYLEEYKRFNQTIANLYISNIKHKTFIARMYNFDSVLDMETYEEQVEKNIMLKNIEYVSRNSNLLQNYFDLKKKILGLDKFYTSDINADINVKNNETKFLKYEDCINDIKNAFAPLGKDYQDMFENALENAWIDAFPREDKGSGGYTISTYLLPHPYILLNFDGTAYWSSAIAHEFGHAMHSYYSAKKQPYAKSEYTIFVAEVASLTNEILFSNYMINKETDKNKKMELLADFLSLFYLNVFNSSMLAEFEYFAHNKIWNGEIVTADDFNSEFIKIFKKYFGKSVSFTKNFEYDWERKSHIFRDYYLYKYSTGLISACAIANKILNDKTGDYVKKYKEFLSLGNSLNPIESLKVADIDITSKKTYDFAFSMFSDYLKKLKEIYEEN